MPKRRRSTTTRRPRSSVMRLDEKRSAAESPYRKAAPVRRRLVDGLRCSATSPTRRAARRRSGPLRCSSRVAARSTSCSFVTMWVKSIWEIEHARAAEDVGRSRGRAAAAAAASAAAGWREAAGRPKITPKKMKVKDIVQPVKIEKQEVQERRRRRAIRTAKRVAKKVASPAVSSVATQRCTGAPPPPPPPPPPPAPPQNVAADAARGLAHRGREEDRPRRRDEDRDPALGQGQASSAASSCASPSTATITSIDAAEEHRLPAVRQQDPARDAREWKYKPYMVNGKAVPVCTAVTFIYSQK